MAFDCKEFLREGRDTEMRFGVVLHTNCGGDVFGADKKTDLERHIDLFWRFKENKPLVSFDVKGMKKENRNDDKPNPDIEWIEFQNVNGDRGWVNGDADYIAFENPNDWIIIRRKKLRDIVISNIHNNYITNDRSLWFRYYQRRGRKDKVVKVPTSLIRRNADKIIIKEDFMIEGRENPLL